MTYKVTLTHDAREDVRAIAEYYLSKAGKTMAGKIIDSIETAILSLQTQPKRGHKPHELYGMASFAELEIIVDRYRIIYLLREQNVFVIAVFDGRQNVQRHLSKRRMNSHYFKING